MIEGGLRRLGFSGKGRALRRSRHVWLNLVIWKRRLLLWTAAVLVGAVAAGFAVASEYANDVFVHVVKISPYLPLIITPLGLAIAVWMTRHVFPGSQGSGIPQGIAALQIKDREARGKLLSLRIAVGKIFVTLFALCAGASVGREGPTVQVGASIMNSLGGFFRFPNRDVQRGLILAGGAAGIAAAFNTPLAGIVFAIEEFARSFEEKTNGTVITTVIVAGIASIAILGNYTYFGHTTASLKNLLSPDAWIAILICALVGGILGGIFARVLIAFARGLPGRAGVFMREHPVMFAAVCGLVLALVGLASGNTAYGTGYAEAKSVIEGHGQNLPSIYFLLKLCATIASYVSGTPGGIFAPSLAVGAGIGHFISGYFMGLPAGAVVVLGMVSYFSGAVQSPITAFVIVMEMTDDQTMIVPLMAASLIAYGTSRIISQKPLYKALSEGFLQQATPKHSYRRIENNKPNTNNVSQSEVY